jgi:hypothetical protein
MAMRPRDGSDSTDAAPVKWSAALLVFLLAWLLAEPVTFAYAAHAALYFIGGWALLRFLQWRPPD